MSPLLSFILISGFFNPCTPQDPAEEAVRRLSSESPETREKASQELKQLGKAAVPDLKAALPNVKDPEVQARIGELLRLAEPAALEALERYLADAKIEALAIDVVKDPIVAKALPKVLFFQVWKKGQASIWKVLGFDQEKKILFDAADDQAWAGYVQGKEAAAIAKVRQQIAQAASSAHASIAAYSEAPFLTLLLKRERPSIYVWVKADGHTVEARSMEGMSLWQTDIVPIFKGEVGAPVVRYLESRGERIAATMGKHTAVFLDVKSGKMTSLGSD